jgi:N4-(beta-N-acetylglucosaminyl)-L-asparaginase
MSEPIILSTWKYGQQANAAGWPHLTGPKASSLDAVEQGCRAIEASLDCLTVGRGGCPDRSGDVSLDASIMQSPSRVGSVCYVRRFEHPVSIARMVMERLRYVLLAGDGAERFATWWGMTPTNLLTEAAKERWARWAVEHPLSQYLDDRVTPPVYPDGCAAGAKSTTPPAPLHEETPAQTPDAPADPEQLPHNQHHDTVCVLAIDCNGVMSGACSTSGLPFKVPGRVGDSPIIGQGLYVDPRRGAAACTGIGELIMGVCGSFLAVELMGRGASPADAAREVIQRIGETYELQSNHQVGIITLLPSGQWSHAALRPGYRTAVRTATRDELVDPEFLLLQQERSGFSY